MVVGRRKGKGIIGIMVVGWRVIPRGVAEWTMALATRGDAGEVEAVGALGGEEGLPLTCCNASQANTACFVISEGTHDFALGCCCRSIYSCVFLFSLSESEAFC